MPETIDLDDKPRPFPESVQPAPPALLVSPQGLPVGLGNPVAPNEPGEVEF